MTVLGEIVWQSDGWENWIISISNELKFQETLVQLNNMYLKWIEISGDISSDM